MKTRIKTLFAAIIAAVTVISFAVVMAAAYATYAVCECIFDYSCAWHIMATFVAMASAIICTTLVIRVWVYNHVECNEKYARIMECARELLAL